MVTQKKKKIKKIAQIKVDESNIINMLQEAENIVLNTVYITENSEHPITLEVNLGTVGQTSDMTITLDQQIIADEIAVDFPAIAIGLN